MTAPEQHREKGPGGNTENGFVHKVLGEKVFSSSIYSTPTIANGKIFVSDRSRLYVFDTE